jgi:phosphopantothenoylcysteine decarboxylase/phosphopantothenate--cysteine ligase
MSDLLYLRSPHTTVAARAGDLIYLNPNHVRVRCLDLHEQASAVHRILTILREPKSLDELVVLTALSVDVLSSILSLLVRERIVVSGPLLEIRSILHPSSRGNSESICKRLVVGISGSIYACQVIRLILQLRNSVTNAIDVILTKEAARFVKPEVFEYFGMRVWTDAHGTRRNVRVPHIELASQADIVMIVPASARTIHRLATGECSDLLSLVIAATDAPVVVVPVMNRRMFAFPPIRTNLDTLRSAGMYVIEPGLACEAGNDSGDMFFSGPGLGDEMVASLLAAILSVEKRNSKTARISDVGECNALAAASQHTVSGSRNVPAASEPHLEAASTRGEGRDAGILTQA